MRGRVADASVVAALIFRERRSEEARSLMAGVELFEPPLLGYELASITRKKIRAEPNRAGPLLGALDVALAMNVQWRDVTLGEVVRLAISENLSTYDATYLQLARSLGVELVTFDRQLLIASRR